MSGITTNMLEGAENTFAINRTQDVQPILEYTKEMNAIGAGNGSEVKHAAEIPMIFVESYLQRTGITFHEFCASQDHVKALVNDPALAAFRIWNGRV